MINKSNELLQIAKDFIREKTSNVIYACVGGSVGSGRADEYSDIDLIVYTNTDIVFKDVDIIYKDKIIQLKTLHINELPNKHSIKSSPWDLRFLSEITIVKDRKGDFDLIKRWATAYFKSANGRQKIFEQVSNIAAERKKSALDSLDQQNFHSATIAALGAWTETGFLYLFFNHNSSATDLLIPRIQNLKLHFDKFKRVSPFSLGNVSVVSKVLLQFRGYLREKGYDYPDLSEIHDTLCDRKIKRLRNRNEHFNLLFQMYGEALWLYFETSNGIPFEDYFDNLPALLQKGLSKIGFVPLEKKNVKEICRLSDELLASCSIN